ncbi:hypothetical protein [Xenorhabdus szentirmaii]|uniref:hypothetical protein n=1 Tax=Xenorhabdus szentirmaii TaxID=290112 RepID=UPI0019C926FB|nr:MULTISPECIES: hypothetical protein [unclassified Xenorhabdus]MBD2782674.1 hypothetical protein [Xenorhabdus sp. 38]MBD2793864.1 hypothetical protein [Xenorhabdus sp. CUL]
MTAPTVNGEEQAQQELGNLYWLSGDLIDESAPGILIDAAIDKFGRIDVAINNGVLIIQELLMK